MSSSPSCATSIDSMATLDCPAFQLGPTYLSGSARVTSQTRAGVAVGVEVRDHRSRAARRSCPCRTLSYHCQRSGVTATPRLKVMLPNEARVANLWT